MTTLSLQSQNARTGRFTGSEIYKLMAPKGFGKTGETYIFEKASEFLTGERCIPEFSSAATAHGEKYEPEAKEYFTAATGIKILPSETLQNDLIAGTPDGLLDGQQVGIEIKCPYNAGNHLKNLLLQDQVALFDLWPEYYWQVYAYMWLTGYAAWKFCSYHPNFPGEKRMLILNVTREEAVITAMKNRVTEAKLMFDNIIHKLS